MRFTGRQRAIRASVHRAYFLVLVSERVCTCALAREATQLKLRFRRKRQRFKKPYVIGDSSLQR